MRIFIKLSLLFLVSLSTNFLFAKNNFELTLDSSSQFFSGYPLNSWIDPKDPRFQDANLKDFFANDFNTKMREELYNLRQSYIAQFKKIYNKPGADYLSLQKQLTKDLMSWTKKHIEAALPAGISEKDYAFVAFGSAGRLESGIITDLEGGLVLSDNVANPADVGLEFGNNLATTLNGLIGHPMFGRKGFRLDEQSNAPIHFAPFVKSDQSIGEILCPMITNYAFAKTSAQKTFWKNYFYPFEGSYVLVTTPQNLAQYARGVSYNMPQIFQLRVNSSTRGQQWYKWASQFLIKGTYTDADYLRANIENSSCGAKLSSSELTNWVNYFLDSDQSNELKVVSAFADIGRNHYFVAGNKDLYDQFVSERNKILHENNALIRKKIASLNFNELISKWSQKKYGGEMFIEGKLPSSGVFDIKRHNYRLIEQFLTAFQSYLNLGVQNPKDIINEMVKDGIFGKDFAHSLLDTVNHLTKLRWLSQIKVDGQLEQSMDFLTTKAYQSKLDSLKSAQKTEQTNLQNAKDPNSFVALMAQSNLAEINYNLAKMAKLEPLKNDSVMNPEEISYLEHVIIPVEHLLFKRIVAFMGSSSNKNLSPKPNAFQDDFDVESIDLGQYNIRVK